MEVEVEIGVDLGCGNLLFRMQSSENNDQKYKIKTKFMILVLLTSYA